MTGWVLAGNCFGPLLPCSPHTLPFLLDSTGVHCGRKDTGVDLPSPADRCLKKAAAQGHADAQYNLGLYYATGRGVKKDRRRALHWYRKSAEQGESDAQVFVGYCYHEGEGVRRDDEEAVRWYRKAARQGDNAAMSNLGLCYRHGHGVRKSTRNALRWFRKAEAGGNELARPYIEAMRNEGGR